MNPLISVIIPAWNAQNTIGRAIESILKQTYNNLEIIVVDDNSTDKTSNIVSEYTKKDTRVKLFKSDFIDQNRFDKKLNRNINAGYSARNTGFTRAKGEYITFQDADDISLNNRIEIQYNLLKQHNSLHVLVDWFPFNQEYVDKSLDVGAYVRDHGNGHTGPDELYNLSQKTKGLCAKIWPRLNKKVPFHTKRMRVVNKLFFGSLENFPGAGNSPLFSRKVIETIRFRKLSDRIWPSFMGRGADRDFNFQVAETFKSSHVFLLPLYMWYTKDDSENNQDVNKYIIN